MKLGAVLSCLVVAGAASACGGSKPAESSGQTALIQADVAILVTFSGEIDRLPFDPRAARLRAASEQLQKIARHPVAFHFDIALLPEYRSSFEDALVHAMETAAQDLRWLEERDPEVFARGAPLVNVVDCRYDASAREAEAKLDAADRRLVVTLPPNASELLPDGLLARAASEEHEKWIEDQWGATRPEAVAPADLARFFRFLTGYRRYGPRAADLSKPEGYLSDPEAREILTVIHLHGLARDGALRDDIRKWLLDHADYLTRAYVEHPALVLRAPRDGSFHRAESEWVNWLESELPKMDDTERLSAVKAVFVRMYNDRVPEYGRYARFAFPGIDPFAVAVGIADEWAHDGHPIEMPDRPDRGMLFEHVICPHPKNLDGNRSRAPRCDYDWYEYALQTKQDRTRLADLLLTRRDPVLTEMVFYNVGMKGELDDLVELWRGVERDPVVWGDVAEIVAEDFAETSDARLLDELRRLWRGRPEGRGALLYILANMDRYGNNRIPWAELRTSFGTLAGPGDFARFVAHGPRAMALAYVVWPMLAPGWSKAPPYVERLEAHFDAIDRTRSAGFGLGVSDFVHKLCEDRDASGLATLHAALASRSERKPSEAKLLANLLEDTKPGACRD